MAVFHDEVEIEDFEYDEDEETYYYPCPCGDRFQITKPRSAFDSTKLSLQEELQAGEEIATCPSCSLIIKVIYDKDLFAEDSEKEEEGLAVAVKGKAVQ